MTIGIAGDRTRLRDAASVSLFPLVVLGVVMVAFLTVWVPALLAADASPNPMVWLIDVVRGQAGWSAAATALAVGLVVLEAAVLAVAVLALRSYRKNRQPIDGRAKYLAQASDLKLMRPQQAAEDASRLGLPDSPGGPVIGWHVPSNELLRATAEWVQVWIMGPRAGKTTCVCIPQVVEAEGPVICTTNKPDLVTHTRGPRSMRGQVWVFDPQQIIGERPEWWWNPLSFIKGFPEAEILANLFAAADTDAGARTDAYFDNEAKNYLACLLLAAKEAEAPITQVVAWMSDPDDFTPVTTLDVAGWEQARQSLHAIMRLADKQRDGVIGTARRSMNWLSNPDVLPWITPSGPDDDRPEFDPHRLVGSSQTLYLVSREGQGTARAITAALTVATITIAERTAGHAPSGRLPVPMLVMLDEAANVVKWPDLPDLYSHFGSRGILVATMLQSWDQGTAVWGDKGMAKMWSAANVRCLGSGLAQSDFLQSVSTLVGQHDVLRRDLSQGGSRGMFESSRSISSRVQRESILEASELSQMPRDRALMLSSGTPATMLKMRHWTSIDDAELVRESERYFTQTDSA